MEGELLIPIFLFGGTAAVLWKYFDSRHRERMAMIEKGISASDLKGMLTKQTSQVNPLSSLKWGLLIGFVGLGLVVANWLDRAYFYHDSIYFACMLVAGGLGLVIFYFIAVKKIKQEGQ